MLNIINKSGETVLTRMLFLPDHWLRRIDLSVTIMSMFVLLVIGYPFTHFSDGMIMWATTSTVGLVLWMTNGTAYIMKKCRSALPDLMLLILLRFGV